jgi:hypothetical protein
MPDIDIKDYAGRDVAKILLDLIGKKKRENELLFYIGKVVNNNDPEQEGKRQLRVYGIYDPEIPDEDLPWATPDFNFIGSTLGSFVVPPIDALVNVYFDNNDFMFPRYSTKVVHRTKLADFSSDISEDYPDSLVFFETDVGEYFKINRKTSVTTYRQASGTIIRIDADGSISIDTTGTETGNITISTLGNVTVNAGGDASIIAEGSVEVTGNGDVSVQSVTGSIKLGGDNATQPVNNLPVCFFTGAAHYLPTMLVPGKSVLVSP